MATSWKLLVRTWIPRGLVPSARVVPEIDIFAPHSSQFSSGVDNGHGLFKECPATNNNITWATEEVEDNTLVGDTARACADTAMWNKFAFLPSVVQGTAW